MSFLFPTSPLHSEKLFLQSAELLLVCMLRFHSHSDNYMSYISMHYFRNKIQTAFILLFCSIVITNFILVIQRLPYYPNEFNEFIVSFFPWKEVIGNVDIKNVKSIRYRETIKLPTRMLLWGLQYTLEGKESYPVRTFQFGKFESIEINGKCSLFYDSILELYGCTDK